MKKLIALFLSGCMLLTFAACGGTGAEKETEGETETEEVTSGQPEEQSEFESYLYEFDGMMGAETAQFDLYSDGTCRFFLPGHPMITDVYVGTYVMDGSTVTVTGLSNVDEESPYAAPGLWDWIVDGGCTLTVTQEHTFLPAGSDSAGKETGNSGDTLKNIPYAGNSSAQVCDIYLPDDGEQAPVILLVHGGGFLFGDQNMPILQPVIARALEHGYAVVSVDYRKSSEAVFPAALADVKAAVRFVKVHGEEYGLNPDKITVWGESAGAYLSLMTALTPEIAELNGDVTENQDVSSAVQALVSFYAPVEFYTLYEEAGKPESAASSFESKFLGQDILLDRDATNRTYWVTYADRIPGDLKVWIQAGDADARVPYTQSENFARRLGGYLGEDNVEFGLIAGADHEDALFYSDENLEAVFAWLEGIMKG